MEAGLEPRPNRIPESRICPGEPDSVGVIGLVWRRRRAPGPALGPHASVDQQAPGLWRGIFGPMGGGSHGRTGTPGP